MTIAFELEPIARAVCAANGYQFVGSVGRGAFKETYEAVEDDTRHALKIYRPSAVNERVDREVDAMLRCNHPNIGRLRRLDRQIVDGRTYLYSVEEFLGGGTLSSRVSAQGPLNQLEAWEMGRLLVSALAHIATNGLVHRDIKPDNIMLREDGRTPVVVDFGIVRTLDQTSITVTWALQGPGTPFFAPPEQLRNEKHLINWRADQFSLGVALSRVTLGRHPYSVTENEDPVVTIARVSDREGLPSAFPQLAATFGLPVLAKMVAPWPIGRYREPNELAVAWAAQRERR